MLQEQRLCLLLEQRSHRNQSRQEITCAVILYWAQSKNKSSRWVAGGLLDPVGRQTAFGQGGVSPVWEEGTKLSRTCGDQTHATVCASLRSQLTNLPLLYPDRNGGLPGQNMDKRRVALWMISNTWPCLSHACSISWSWLCVTYFLTFALSQDHTFLCLPLIISFPYFLGFNLT